MRQLCSLPELGEGTPGTLSLSVGEGGACSLLVGGIGVMNIMLVSVTERPREIGIRRAAGARMGDILLQFNAEAVVICTLGGLAGLTLGYLIGFGLRGAGLAVAFTPTPAALAFASAVSTGLVFGHLPARKAARLDPVVALGAE